MGRERTVLILDDEILAAMGLKSRLIAAGWEHVFIAGSYERAVEIVKTTSPTAAVVDINLQAEYSGLDFLRQTPSSLERIVILSGYGAESYNEELRGVDYDVFLEKPVPFEAVVEALE
jgi:ActR/RegA family two-component response regulator